MRTLPAAAAFADAVNRQVGVSELCESVGRDPATLRRTHAPNFQPFDSEREFARWRQDERRGMSSEEVYAHIRDRGALYGTVSTIEQTIQAFTDVGCVGFMVFCNSAPSAGSLHQLGALPSMRRAVGASRYGAPWRGTPTVHVDVPSMPNS